MTDIHDIKGLELSAGGYGLLLPIAAALLLLAAGYLGYRRMRRKHFERNSMSMPPAQAAALQGLDALERLGPEMWREWAFGISYLLRRYLQDRYGLRALGMTADELVPHIEKAAIHKGLQDRMKEMLVSWESAKFGGAVPEKEKQLRDLKDVRDIVHATSSRRSVAA